MKNAKYLLSSAAGAAAGIANGLFGSGGGTVLIPILEKQVEEKALFPTSVAVMMPICVTALASSGKALPWGKALPYLIGSALGGLIAGLWGKKVPVLWLHRAFGLLLLWGGVRCLW